MAKYPKVNYIGNKEKLVDWITEEMPVKHGTVVDIFAGGCSVSYALKNKGYLVMANDILYADYVIAKALIENESDTLSTEVFSKAVSGDCIDKKANELEFLSERLYFPEEIRELARLICISETLKGNKRYMFLALLRRAMIRKLPYSRMNVPWNQIERLRDEEYSYKHYGRKRAYHNESFETHMIANLNSYNEALIAGMKPCKVYHLDALSMAKKITHVDVVYMDPPYPSTMNNYDAFYGLFDTIFSKEKPHIDFTQTTTFLDNMEKLIQSLVKKTDYIVISQNDRVKPTPEQIIQMLERYGTVTVKKKEHNYQVTGRENKNGGKELLFLLHIK